MNATLLSTDQEVTTADELDHIELTSTEMRLVGGGEAVVIFD